MFDFLRHPVQDGSLKRYMSVYDSVSEEMRRDWVQDFLSHNSTVFCFYNEGINSGLRKKGGRPMNPRLCCNITQVNKKRETHEICNPREVQVHM